MPNPLLEKLLPTLLFIQLISLLDDALEAYRSEKNVNLGPKQKHDLYNRIELLKSRLKSPGDLHSLRERRRDLAHDLAFVEWQPLHEAIDRVEEELRHLQLVGARPKYEFFAERSGAKASDDPRYLFEWDYQYGLKKNGEVEVSINWTKRVERAGSP